MKLDRNAKGQNKYLLIKNRKLQELLKTPDRDLITHAIGLLDDYGLIEKGLPNTEGEFFVIKLRDAFARDALTAYAYRANEADEKEYGTEVMGLAQRSGDRSPFCKRPD